MSRDNNGAGIIATLIAGAVVAGTTFFIADRFNKKDKKDKMVSEYKNRFISSEDTDKPKVWNEYLERSPLRIKFYEAYQQCPDDNMIEQIDKDVPRTHFNFMTFSDDQRAQLRRILLALSGGGGIPYLQGMNMLCGYLITLKASDSDIFSIVYHILTDKLYKFNKFLAEDFVYYKEFRDAFYKSIGINDVDLKRKLQRFDVVSAAFLQRWITLFCTTKLLRQSDILLVWDYFILYGWSSLIRFSICILLYHKAEIMKQDDDDLHCYFSELFDDPTRRGDYFKMYNRVETDSTLASLTNGIVDFLFPE